MTAWRQSLERIGLRIPPGSGGFWRWWQAALLAWLPARWQWRLGFSPARLLLWREGGEVALAWQRAQGVEPLARLPEAVPPADWDALLPPRLRPLPRYWLLPASAALRRPLRLPAAAAARLQDVARFEIDRQTPFAADQVWFDARALGHHGDAQLDAELVVVPRRVVDGDAGIAPAWRELLAGVDVRDGDGQPLRVNLLPLAERHVRRDPMARWNLAVLATGLIALAIGAQWLLDNRAGAADALEEQVRGDAQRARQVAMQREELTALIEGAAFFEQQRAARPAAIEVWNELSQRLPDGTYLEKFSLEGDQLQLIGLSDEAAALVERLDGAPTWRKPALTGVLQSDAGKGRDRFTITATLAAPPATPAPAAGGAR
ncbi:general secretion pathway protein GspL [Stenotrophomonas panacihumi]|uniref:General secretion pathway protein GspL n=1 Tax=Stenotrophomonas panacihumi TaxID=676599 RepID=A0A0R0AYE6_9GAMM|nr:PilN domain-containing protein [Stenotrophomonas panacihumi]KRG45555.1 general secretion pathway protein GspL [Stenotrophomonas panacihumi]PTN55308.1 general secretion pathway protein GspL [Stenotrophomonas panacihumi]